MTGISEKKLTVLFVFHNCDLYSGATRSLLDIIESYMVNQSVNIIALFPKKQGTAVEYLSQKNVRIITCFYTEVVASMHQHWIKKMFAFPYRLLRLLISINSIYSMKKVLKELKIDVVYTNTSVIIVGGVINKLFKIPHLWHFREFRREDQQLEFFFGEKLFFKFANKYSNKIVVISKSMYEKHVEGIDRNKLQVIYNDISPSFINPKLEFNINKPNLQLLITGVLSEGKGQIDVLRALKILKEKGYNIILNIAGSTNVPYYEVLKQYVEVNELESNVIFHGLVKDMTGLRAKMDVGIVASKKEAFGRVTIEGMLSSLAMIGSNSAGTSELIDDNNTGLLYNPNDIDGLVEKIEYFYNRRSEMQRIALNGLRYAMDNHTVGKCSLSLQSLMLDIAKTK